MSPQIGETLKKGNAGKVVPEISPKLLDFLVPIGVRWFEVLFARIVVVGSAAMLEILNNPIAQLALSVLFLSVMIALGYAGVSSLRDWSRKSESLTPEPLSNFEEMRREGDISEAEFRNIEAVLGRKGVQTSERKEDKP